MDNAPTFSSLVAEAVAKEIAQMKSRYDQSPSVWRMLSHLGGIKFFVDSSSEILTAFSGVRGISYPADSTPKCNN